MEKQITEKRYGSVTKDKFKCVKILLESKTKYEEITSMVGVSEMTIWRIKNAETFEEYRQNQRLAAMKAKQKKRLVSEEAKRLEEQEIKKQEELKRQEEEERRKAEERKQEKPQMHPTNMQNNYQMNRIAEYLKELIGIQTIISNKLAYVVEELTK